MYMTHDEEIKYAQDSLRKFHANLQRERVVDGWILHPLKSREDNVAALIQVIAVVSAEESLAAFTHDSPSYTLETELMLCVRQFGADTLFGDDYMDLFEQSFCPYMLEHYSSLSTLSKVLEDFMLLIRT